MEWLTRTELLLGKEKLEKLNKAHILIAGLGGVGSYAAEQLCRAGIGNMTIVDGDTIDISNINRQLPALHSTVGKSKAQVVAQRLKDINPNINLIIIEDFLKDEKIPELLKNNYDYVVDAIDTLAPKVFLIYNVVQAGLKLISSMGSGGKMDPTKITIADVKKSYNCNLARMLRKRLHRLGIRKGFKVIFSPEEVSKDAVILQESENKKSNVGTISYMPAIFGCYCASVVISDLIKD